MITKKKLDMYFKAKREDSWAPSANDNYNKMKWGMVQEDFKEIRIALSKTFGMFPPSKFTTKDIHEMNENYSIHMRVNK